MSKLDLRTELDHPVGRDAEEVGGAVGGPGKALQGNLDPNALFAPADALAAEARRVLDAFGKPHTDKNTTGPTQIFNLGHGITPDANPDNVQLMIDTVRNG